MIRVEVDGFGPVEFPDGTSQDTMHAVLMNRFGPKPEDFNARSLAPVFAMDEPGVTPPQPKPEPKQEWLTASEPGLLERIRGSWAMRKLAGPTAVEREGMIEPGVSPMDLVSTAFKFASPPPQIADALRQTTDPLIQRTGLSEDVQGMVTGARDFALNFPWGAAGVNLGKSFGRALLGVFTGEYAFSLPEVKAQFDAAVRQGDHETAGRIATESLLNGALLATGAIHMTGRGEPLTRQQEAIVDAVEYSLKRPVGLPRIDEAAREALSQRAGEVQQPFAPEAPASAIPTPEPMGAFRQVTAPMPKRAQEPTVPETPPETERGLTVLQEIRQKGLRTKEQIREVFPQINREQAAELRRLAWPEDPINKPQPTQPKVEPDITQGIAEALAAGDFNTVKKLAQNIPNEFTGVSESVFDLGRIDDLAPKTADALRAVIKQPKKGVEDASKIAKSEGVFSNEVREGVVKTPPLRQQWETPEAQAEAPPIEAKPPVTEPPAQPVIPESRITETAKPAEATSTPDQVYDAALKDFRTESGAFRKAQEAYRAKTIGDQEFLSAKARFDKAQTDFDKAETSFIESKNKPAEAAPEAKALETVAKPAKAIAKVESEVKSVIKTEGMRPAKDVKAELVQRIEESLAKAPTEDEVRARSYTKVTGETIQEQARRDKITIEIPGDGSFTVWNTKENLELLLKRAKRIPVTDKPKKGPELKESNKYDPDKTAEVALSVYKDPQKAIESLQRQAAIEDLDSAQRFNLERAVEILRESLPENILDRKIVEKKEEVENADANLTVAKKNLAASKSAKRKTAVDVKFIKSEEIEINQVEGRLNRAKADLAELQAERAKIKTTASVTPPSPVPGEAGKGSNAPGAIGGPGLTPITTTATALTPKGQDQIIRDLAKGLKLPIRFGRLRTSKFAGYFLPIQKLIATKKPVDVPSVSHEVGHAMETSFGFTRDPRLTAELDHLGDNARPGSRSSWTPSKTRQYRYEEGVAEFVRYWLTDLAEARRLGPNMERAFNAMLDANKDIGDTLRTAQSDILTWRTATEEARLQSHISTSNPNETPYTISQLTRDAIDDLHVTRLVMDDAARGTGSPVNVMDDMYKAGRLLRGSFGMAETFINKGVVDWRTKSVRMGTSLEDALKPVAGRMNEFRGWIVAKRAQELHRNGKSTGLLQGDIDATAAKYDAVPEFQEAFQKVKAWNDALLKYVQDSGMITPSQAAAMRAMNQDYVPFHRLFEVGAGEMPAEEGLGTGRGLNFGTPGSLRRQTGSVRPIIDPLETMVKNAYALVTAAEKSVIHQQIAKLSELPGMGKWVERIATPKEHVRVGLEKIRKQLEDAGADLTNVPDDLMMEFYRQAGRAPWGENIIRVKVGDKAEFFRLNKDLFETFHALDYEDSGKIIRMISGSAQLLRAGVTLTPDFALFNAMRDAFSSAIISKHWMLPGEATLRGLAALVRDPKMVAEWAASGGKFSVEVNYFDRTKLQTYLTRKIANDLTPAERASIVVKSPLTALRWLSGTMEEATRIGEYQVSLNKYLKQGIPEGEARRMAAFEARDRQDFAKGGAHTKTLRMLTPFWNAALQANVKLFQAFRERPIQTALKGMAFIMLPKMIEQALNWNDENYWDRPQWERDLFFLIPRGKDANGRTQFIRLPVPFEPGLIFASLPGRLLQWAKQNKPDSVKEFPAMFLKNAVPNPIPPPVQVVFQDFLSGKQGWDIFRARPIVPDSIADLPPELQWTEQTSLTARKVGKVLGFSPMKVDHIISQTTGGLGKQITYNIIDRAISAMTGEKVSPIGAVPGMRFLTTPAGISSQAVETFYQYNSVVQGDAQAVKKSPGYNRQYPGAQSMFNSAVAQMSRLRKQIRTTEDQDKKQQLYLRISEIAKRVNKNFESRYKKQRGGD